MYPSSGNQHQSGRLEMGTSSGGGKEKSNQNSSDPLPWFRLHPEEKVHWTAQEDARLQECLIRFSYIRYNMILYSKIANELPNKAMRHVVVRIKTLKERKEGKRQEDGSKIEAKRKVSNPSKRVVIRDVEMNDRMSYKAVTGVNGRLLQENELAIKKMSSNLTIDKLHENFSLICQVRDNIRKLVDSTNNTDGIIQFEKMPPLPVKVNDELINAILPPMMNPNNGNNS